jgi:nucleotide-binding universal stress UspA family protein
VKRLLVPLDGSSLSEAVLPLAEALAHDTGAELVFLQALRAQGSLPLEAKAQEDAEAYLYRTTETRTALGLAARWVVWYDDPDQAIVDAATVNEVDLIVMATHGRGGLGRLLLGSVAERVVRRAPAPVLLVRDHSTQAREVVGKILVPLDRSRLSEGVLSVVERLAGSRGAGVCLVHAVEPGPPPLAGVPLPAEDLMGRWVAEAEDHLARVAERLEAQDIAVTCVVRTGAPPDVILRCASEAGAGLVAMTTHGRTGLDRLLMGSVAEQIVRAAPTPVLLWKAPADATRP